MNDALRPDAKNRILDAAERLFGEHGYDGASLRAITAEAGVNLAAVNYHFRSKEALVEAVFARRLEPLNRERLALLDAYEAAAGDGLLPVEQVVQALVGPVLRMTHDRFAEGASFRMLIGRMFTDLPSRFVQRIFLHQLRNVVRRFHAAFQRALPDVAPDELFWRIHFSIGALAHTMAAGHFLKIASGGLCDDSDVDATISRLVAYISGGLRAPLARHRKAAVGAARIGRKRRNV